MPATILIVDDEEITRSTLDVILRQNGYDVVSASSAAEALQAFRSNDVSVVLLDYFLPDGGENLGPQIRKLNATVSIIVFSGDPDAGAARSYSDALIAKPVHPSELLSIIAQYVKRAA